MPYAKRNEQGQVTALFAEQNEEAKEWLAADAWQVKDFLGTNMIDPEGDEIIEHLSVSDIRMVRVLEDLLEVLIANKVILFTDLPTAAQVKLLERRSARSKLTANNDDTLIANDSDAIMI